ncbi:MAG: hypothetical protein PVF45_14210 [Anaerolineae bacterium]|jgi:hypothetical protein
MHKSLKSPSLFVAALVSLMAVACASSTESTPQPSALSPTSPGKAPTQGTPTPTDIWSALLEKEPFPYTTPLPPRSPTILDGLYAKFEPKQGTAMPCRRCPDYLPEGGVWRLSLEDGVFRVFHAPTGWHSLGSFALSGDRITFFNDPYCYAVVGVYTWRREGGELKLELVEDACQLDRRARNFTKLPWAWCGSAAGEACGSD